MAGRRLIQDIGGLSRVARAGDGVIEIVAPAVVAGDANYTLTATDVAKGVLSFSSWTVGRNLTTDTAANLLATFSNMDIGDCISMHIGISVAFAGTMVAGTGITLKGKAAVPASGAATLYFTRTGAATFDCLVV